jgi:hypothetical protein
MRSKYQVFTRWWCLPAKVATIGLTASGCRRYEMVVIETEVSDQPRPDDDTGPDELWDPDYMSDPPDEPAFD